MCRRRVWLSLFISPSRIQVSETLCRNRAALRSRQPKESESVCAHGIPGPWIEIRFSTRKGLMARGVPTAAAAEPLKSRLLEDSESRGFAALPGKSREFRSRRFTKARRRHAPGSSLTVRSHSGCHSEWKDPRAQPRGRTSGKTAPCLIQISMLEDQFANSLLSSTRLLSLVALRSACSFQTRCRSDSRNQRCRCDCRNRHLCGVHRILGTSSPRWVHRRYR